MIMWYRVGMLTVQQAAERAGRNPETIRRWIRSGRLSANKFGAQHVIDADELDEAISGPRAAGLPDDIDPQLRDALDWAVRIVREVRDDAR